MVSIEVESRFHMGLYLDQICVAIVGELYGLVKSFPTKTRRFLQI